MKRFATIALFLAGIAGFCRAQPNPASSVSGTVTNAAGDPLEGATVALDIPDAPWTGAMIGAGPFIPPPAYKTSTGAQGRFELPDINPGPYYLSIKMDGYVEQARRTVLTIGSGQRLNGADFKLLRLGAISGRILDQDGKPFPGLRVSAARRVFIDGQRQAFIPQAGSRTLIGEDGAFTITGLLPGVYYLDDLDALPSFQRLSLVDEEAVTDPSSATPITVAAGETVHVADRHLRRPRFYHVRGKVIDDSTGDPFSREIGARLSGPSWTSGVQVSNGTFGLLAPPGTYTVTSVPDPRALHAGTPTFPLMGRQTVIVAGADVNDVVVRLRPTSEITVHVFPNTGNMRIRLVALDDLTTGETLYTQTQSAFHQVEPSRYRVEVTNPPGLMYVKSIRFGQQDITHAPLDLTSGAGGQLDILLAPNAASVSGVARDPEGTPLPRIIVTLWTPGLPPNLAAGFSRSATTNGTGEFQFTNLPPGKYRVAAWDEGDSGLGIAPAFNNAGWESIPQGLGTVPEFRSQFDTRATSITVKEDRRARVDPVLFTRNSIEAAASKLK